MSSLPPNQLLPPYSQSYWQLGLVKGWHYSALHLFKGKGVVLQLLAWDFCTLEERSISLHSSTMSCVSREGMGRMELRRRAMGKMLAWQQGACATLYLLISP